MAADMAQAAPAKAPPAAAPPFSWSGAYVGAQVGFGWADVGGEMTNWARRFPVDFSTNANGILGGAYGGYNWQINQVVFGIEGDIEGSALSGSSTYPSPYSSYLYSQFVDGSWQASVRARLGYALDRTLIYATAGIASGDIGTEFARLGKVFHHFSSTRTGWTVGAGIEQALSQHVTTRLEYRYTDLGNVENADGSNSLVSQSVTQQAVRVGLAYKF